jgi:radical SAM protein with 4Fe4S-binding SPASM domain
LTRSPSFDPLSPGERAKILAAPRPRVALPLYGTPKQHAPLGAEARAVDRGDRPIYAVWELTLKCDLACRHCGSRAGAARPDELALTEALDLVRQLAELGLKELTLIGGEVYLYEGWTDVVRETRRRGIQCSIVTGGRGFTLERAKAARAAGVQTVSFSVDGDEATHDRLRGVSGAYRAVLEAMGNAREVGLPLSVNTQINRLSAPHLRHVYELVCAAGAHGWQIQLTVPAGRAADEPEVLLQPYDLLEIFPLLAELKQSADRAGIKCLAGNNIGYFGPFDHILRDLSACGHSGSCMAGRLGLGIEANGDIKGCPSLPTEQWVGGNVREYSLRDIWERSTPLRYNRDRTVKNLSGFCRTCYYADECRGGCTWMAVAVWVEPGHNPYCHHRARALERTGHRERVRMIEKAPGTPFDHGRWEIVVEPTPPR